MSAGLARENTRAWARIVEVSHKRGIGRVMRCTELSRMGTAPFPLAGGLGKALRTSGLSGSFPTLPIFEESCEPPAVRSFSVLLHNLSRRTDTNAASTWTLVTPNLVVKDPGTIESAPGGLNPRRALSRCAVYRSATQFTACHHQRITNVARS
jgi:hypothetical protein